MNQDYVGKVRWVIVDDGEQAQDIRFNRKNWLVEIIRPSHRWKEGANTQKKNLLAGLRIISDQEKLVIIEDDDYYASNYLSSVDNWLNEADLVGESCSIYYNIKTQKYRQLPNMFHSSLCSTAMKGSAIHFFRSVCTSNDIFLDVLLWKKYKGSKQLYRSNMVVGIKGMAGRNGIGMGHKKDFQGKIDIDKSEFIRLIGKDAYLYG